MRTDMLVVQASRSASLSLGSRARMRFRTAHVFGDTGSAEAGAFFPQPTPLHSDRASGHRHSPFPTHPFLRVVTLQPCSVSPLPLMRRTHPSLLKDLHAAAHIHGYELGGHGGVPRTPQRESLPTPPATFCLWSGPPNQPGPGQGPGAQKR